MSAATTIASGIRRITESDHRVADGLARLLIDAVDGGASVGFLAPLARETAAQYWAGVFASLGSELYLWIAEQEGEIVGSVQLAPCGKENGRHRAEVQKLFVLAASRGRGIAARLMAEAEGFARADGRSLLVLDTQAGSVAESVYRRLGWQRAVEIPMYAMTPAGDPHATVYYYKMIAPRAGA